MTDPYEPDWSLAPKWAKWHTVDDEGMGAWWKNSPAIMSILEEDGGGNCYRVDVWGASGFEPYDSMTTVGCHQTDITDLDWRNSLRHRPEHNA